MAIIRPFKGIFYNQKKIALNKVTAPPYDVISGKEVENLYRQSRYNIIRLIAGRTISLPLTSSVQGLPETQKSGYRQAKELFHKWLEKGILQEASKPALYIYRQRYYSPSSFQEKVRVGFFSLLKLNQQGKGVFSHEKTFSFPIKDRLRLLQECSANFSAIFALYEDRQREISGVISKYLKRKPRIDFCDAQKVGHTLWAIEKEDDINLLIKKMRRKPIFIADGHHRYSAALRFYQEMKTKESSFVLTYLAEMNEDNISVLPTHRVVFLTEKEREDFWERVKRLFEVEVISRPIRTHSLEIYYQGDYYLLKPKSSFSDNPLALLHNILINKVLGIKSSEEKERIRYTHSSQEAIELARKHKGVAFFIESFKLEEIKKIISKGKTLPRKSTYFYPKLLSGMVMRKVS